MVDADLFEVDFYIFYSLKSIMNNLYEYLSQVYKNFIYKYLMSKKRHIIMNSKN